MPDPGAEIDPYKVLQVDPEADVEIIQLAYRRLARRHHPDVDPGMEARDRMARLNAAWEILRDPARRAAYDRSRAATGGGETRQTPGRPPVGRRHVEEVPRDWAPGRSTTGSGYDPASMRSPDAPGAAGPPPGGASGSVLNFGRYAGWSLGEIARTDLDYLEWLDRMSIGRAFREEIDVILRANGRRRTTEAEAPDRRGLFRRR